MFSSQIREGEERESLAGERIILVSTHVVSDIEPIAKEIILIKAGRILDRGTVEGLCEKYGCGCGDVCDKEDGGAQGARGKYGSLGGLEEVYMRLFGEEERCFG